MVEPSTSAPTTSLTVDGAEDAPTDPAPSTEPEPPPTSTSEPKPAPPAEATSTPTTAREAPVWGATERCDDPDRPAYVQAVFLSHGPAGPWPHERAVEAMERSGLATDHIRRKEHIWSSSRVTYATGTVGSLRSAASALASTSFEGLYPPQVGLTCEGMVSLEASFIINYDHHDVTLEDLLARHGGVETFDSGYMHDSTYGTRFVQLRTPDQRFVIRRIIEWIHDPDVSSVDAGRGCTGVPEDPPPPGCDTRVEPSR